MKSFLYPMIFKRKSFHLFRNVGSEKISNDELDKIEKAYTSFETLYPEIKTKIRIVKAEDVNFKRDAQYCILIYSEKKDNYLINAGYIGQQLDLYLVSQNIATLWFGIGRPDLKTYEGLDYVIMIAIHKVSDESLYRKDMFKAKRKPIEEIWSGDYLNIAEIARFSPSSCNTQPWFVKHHENEIEVYRYKKQGKRGIMPFKLVLYYNRIDIGIFLCILEICLEKQEISYDRNLYIDSSEDEYSLVARYFLKNN